MPRTTTRQAPHRASARFILPVLVFVTLVMSMVATLGTPMVPTIARQMGVSLEAAQWLLTVTLLVGAVVTPITGRLADGPHRKRVVLGALLAVCVGASISALIPFFAPFIFGRALQGFGLALVPMTIAVARDTLPREQARNGVALLSVTTAVGTGLGYPLTGLLGERFSYQVAFGFAAVISLVGVGLVWRVLPVHAPQESHRLDLMGAVLLSLALVCLLLVISQGGGWGWSSWRIIALATGSVVCGTLWVVQELRVAHPLVELRLSLNPLVMSANVTALLMGMGLFAVSSLVSRFVQAPEGAGYGFGAGLLVAGMMLMPLSAGSLASTWFSRWLNDRLGPFLVLPIGSSIVAVSGMLLAFARSEVWEILLAVALLGLGISTTFAAIPALIIRAVPPHETGSATGLNSVLRSVGGAIGSAASIALLSSYTPAGGRLPTDYGYTVAFLAGAVACLGSALASFLLTPRDLE
ncbi:MAG TPA: MFS transporter [Thermomicrobiales bacterium]|nr:MFS transporter [Thermomicrobiales bacterium]